MSSELLIEHVTPIAVQIIILIGIFVTGLFAYLSNKNAAKVNDAVNNVHKDHPRLFDLCVCANETNKKQNEKIEQLIKWKKGYEGGPLDNGLKVEAFMDDYMDMRRKINEIHEFVKRDNGQNN